MIIYDKLITVYPSGSIVYHNDLYLKRSKIKIKKKYLLNKSRPYTPHPDVLEHLEKSIYLKNFIHKVKIEERKNNYLKAIINARDILKLGLNFFKNLQYIQYDYISKNNLNSICQESLKIESLE